MADAKSTLQIVINATASRAVSVLRSIGATLKNVLGSVWSFVSSWRVLLTTTLLSGGLFVAAKSFVQLGANMETTRLQLQTLMGDVAQGNRLFAELREFSNVTPFSTDAVVSAGKTLKSFGVEAESIIPTLKSIGNAAAVSGKDLNELAAIYGKTMAKGRVEAEALNQFQEAGIPILKQLSANMKVAETSIYKMASEGKIAARDIELAFAKMSEKGGAFYGALDKMSTSTNGRISTIQGKLKDMLATVSEQLQPVVQKFLEYVDAFLDSFKGKVNDGSIAQSILQIVAIALKGVVSIIEWIDKIAAVIMTIWDVAAGVIANIDKASGGTLTGIRDYIQNSLIGDTLKMIDGAIATVWDVVSGIFNSISGLVSVVAGIIAKAIAWVVDGIASAWNWIMKKIKMDSLAINAEFNEMTHAFADASFDNSSKLLMSGTKKIYDAASGNSYEKGIFNEAKEGTLSFLGDISGVDLRKSYAENLSAAGKFTSGAKDMFLNLSEFAASQAATIKDTIAKRDSDAKNAVYSKSEKQLGEDAMAKASEAAALQTSNSLRAIGGYGLGNVVESASEKKRNTLLAQTVEYLYDIRKLSKPKAILG